MLASTLSDQEAKIELEKIVDAIGSSKSSTAFGFLRTFSKYMTPDFVREGSPQLNLTGARNFLYKLDPRLVSSLQQQLKGRRVIFVAGVGAEVTPTYFLRNMEIVAALGAEPVFVAPPTDLPSHVAIETVKLALIKNAVSASRPLLIFGHSKGGLETAMALADSPYLFMSAAVEKAVLIQAPMNGTSMAISLSDLMDRVPTPIRSLSSSQLHSTFRGLNPKKVDEWKKRIVTRLRGNERERLQTILKYVISSDDSLPQSKPGERSDGWLNLEDQSGTNIGQVLAEYKARHTEIAMDTSFADRPDPDRRRQYTVDILTRLLDLEASSTEHHDTGLKSKDRSGRVTYVAAVPKGLVRDGHPDLMQTHLLPGATAHEIRQAFLQIPLAGANGLWPTGSMWSDFEIASGGSYKTRDGAIHLPNGGRVVEGFRGIAQVPISTTLIQVPMKDLNGKDIIRTYFYDNAVGPLPVRALSGYIDLNFSDGELVENWGAVIYEPGRLISQFPFVGLPFYFMRSVVSAVTAFSHSFMSEFGLRNIVQIINSNRENRQVDDLKIRERSFP